MSRNEDRLGGAPQIGGASPTASVAATATSTPKSGLAPLEFVRPTSLVSLPSGGRFYPEGHPLCGVSELEIRHMTTAEEDILTSRVLLKKGVAIDKFLQRLIVDSVDPNDMLLGDKSAILVQARVDGYGADYTTQVQCPACAARIKHTFNLQDYQLVEGVDASELEGVSVTSSGTFVVSLENGWEVELRAMNGHDEKKMAKSIEQRKKSGFGESSIQEQLKAMIVSISGHTDRGTITQAVSHMTGKQSKKLREVYSKLIPNIDLKQEVTCVECLNTSEMEVPLTSDFFWPKQ